VRVTGGGARSALWRQICADVLERPIVSLVADEGPAFGAALIAGSAVGLYPSLPEACRRAVRLGSEVTPVVGRAMTYRALYSLYSIMYPAVRDVMHGLDGLSQERA
jgi:xylulokinase